MEWRGGEGEWGEKEKKSLMVSSNLDGVASWYFLADKKSIEKPLSDENSSEPHLVIECHAVLAFFSFESHLITNIVQSWHFYSLEPHANLGIACHTKYQV